MSISNYSSARRAGFKLSNKGVDKNAVLAMTKIGTRTLYVPLVPGSFYLSGASVALAVDGIFPYVLFPDANAGHLYGSSRLPTEWKSGTDVIVTIYWKSAANTGNAKFTVDLAAKADGETTALSNTQTVTTTAKTTASQLNKSQVTFAASLFAAGDWIGLHVTRDPADAADTLGADVKIVNVVIEFTGRG